MAGEIHFYGRAAARSGAERIARIASYVSPQDFREFDSGYDRAGGAAASAAAPAELKWTGRWSPCLALGQL